MRTVFRTLLRLMPKDFRKEYGEELARVGEERWREARARSGPLGRASFLVRESAAMVRHAALLRRGNGRRRGAMAMEAFVRDLGRAVRSLSRRPGFVVGTAGTLALGIGSVTTIFSAVNTVLLRPLPYGDPDRVVTLFESDVETGARGDGVSAANLRDLARQSTLLASVAVAEPWSSDYRGDGRVESLRAWAVGRGFFRALRVEAMLGRTFTEDEYTEGNEAVVLLGHRSWVNRFGADPKVVGRTLTLDDAPVTVVGVLPPGFRFPDEGELWLPRPPRAWDDASRAQGYMSAVARVAPGASLQEAQAETDRIAASLAETYPDVNRDKTFRLVPLREHLFGDVRTPLMVLLAAVGFVLLIACANVASLMLARGAQREREYALRGALGASFGRLVAHAVTESVVLAGVGCALGIGITYAGVAAIGALEPDHLPRIDELQVDGTVLAFGLAVGALSALLAGVAPCLGLARPDVRRSFAGGNRSSRGVAHGRLRGRLVVVQVAAAVVLLIGAGLLVRSFGALLDEELGFDPENRIAVQVFAYDYDGPAQRAAFLRQALENIEAIPGIGQVALTSEVPGATDGVIARMDIVVPFTVVGRDPPPEGQEPVVRVNLVSAGLFDVMDIALRSGRDFSLADDARSPPVAIVNEAVARRHFGKRDPVGERVRVAYGNPEAEREIVGVVADVRPLGHAFEPRPEVFLPLPQSGSGGLVFVARADVDAATLTAPVMQAIWEANPAQAIWGATTVESLLADWLVERRFNLFLIVTLSLVALALSAVGIYGLVRFSVERRVGELGIRRALGGGSGALVGTVLREAVARAGIGVGLGVAGSLGLSRFVRGMLYEVGPTDPLTFLLLSVSVILVAGVASVAPALRVLRVDPVRALRSE